MQQIRAMAKERGVKAGKLKKAELIQALQRQEGNNECFGTAAYDSCGQDNCLWRADCKTAQK